MNTNYSKNQTYVSKSSDHESKKRSLEEILTDVDLIISQGYMFNDQAMLNCQSIGFNGFKRMHRRDARFNFNNHLCLINEAFDKYCIVITDEYQRIDYNYSDILSILCVWESILEESIRKLGYLNFEYFTKTGLNCSVAEKTIKHLAKRKEKIIRYYKRFKETSEHDWHVVDDKIHKKEKMKEMKEMRY